MNFSATELEQPRSAGTDFKKYERKLKEIRNTCYTELIKTTREKCESWLYAMYQVKYGRHKSIIGQV